MNSNAFSKKEMNNNIAVGNETKRFVLTVNKTRNRLKLRTSSLEPEKMAQIRTI